MFSAISSAFSAVSSAIEQQANRLVHNLIFEPTDLSLSQGQEGPVNNLTDDCIFEIFVRTNLSNVHAIACVSQRFNTISISTYASQNFCQFMLSLCPWTFAPINLPLPASELQSTTYEHLASELRDLGLEPSVVGLKKGDLSSYREANRLIEAKNFCLFCHRLPGFTFAVNLDRLQTVNDIYVQEKVCRSQFENSFDPKSITQLWLEGCYPRSCFTRLPKEIALFEALKMLDLHNNRLRSLPDYIQNLKGLKELALSGNHFSSVPDCVCNLPGLKILF